MKKVPTFFAGLAMNNAHLFTVIVPNSTEASGNT